MHALPSGLTLLLCAALASGCANTPAPSRSGFLDDYTVLQPDPSDSNAELYVKPGVSLKAYDKVLLEPVAVRLPSGDERPAIDPADLETLRTTFQNTLTETLEPDYPLVNAPGPGVLRMRVAITDLVPTYPVVSLVVLALPFSFGVDFIASGGSGSPPYLGQTAFEGELRDSESGDLLVALTDRDMGKKYSLGASEGSATEQNILSSYASAYSTWAYAEAAFRYWAGRLRQRLDEAHGRTPPLPAAPVNTPEPGNNGGQG